LWHAGFTENISESGVIIRSDDAGAAPHSRVTVVIALPSSDITPGGWLIGEGTVVRNAFSSAATPGLSFAVDAEFELARREDVPDTIAN
jgi:hypothetical protein